MRRNLDVALINFTLPITAITALNFLAYFIEIGDFSNRLLHNMTVVLTVVAFRATINAAVPPGGLKFIDWFHFAHVTALLITAIGFAVASVFDRRGNDSTAQAIDLVVGVVCGAVVGVIAIAATTFGCYHRARGDVANIHRAQQNAIKSGRQAAKLTELAGKRAKNKDYRDAYDAGLRGIRNTLCRTAPDSSND